MKRWNACDAMKEGLIDVSEGSNSLTEDEGLR